MIKELNKKIQQLQYEIKLLGIDREELTGVTIRINELSDIVNKLTISSVSSSLPDSDEVYRMAHELDEKEFDQWMFEQQ